MSDQLPPTGIAREPVGLGAMALVMSWAAMALAASWTASWASASLWHNLDPNLSFGILVVSSAASSTTGQKTLGQLLQFRARLAVLLAARGRQGLGWEEWKGGVVLIRVQP